MTNQKQVKIESSQLSYEEAFAELENIVQKLERAESSLEETTQLFERGVSLSQFCIGTLNTLEEKITKITPDGDGKPIELPLYFNENK